MSLLIYASQQAIINNSSSSTNLSASKAKKATNAWQSTLINYTNAMVLGTCTIQSNRLKVVYMSTI